MIHMAKKNKLPSAALLLKTLAGVMAMGLPYKKGICISCGVTESKKHHTDCYYLDALNLIVKYYKP